MDKNLDKLEKKLIEGVGVMSIAEGQLYLFEYVREALFLIRKELKKLPR